MNVYITIFYLSNNDDLLSQVAVEIIISIITGLSILTIITITANVSVIAVIKIEKTLHKMSNILTASLVKTNLNN